jgi:hypothetical protein
VFAASVTSLLAVAPANAAIFCNQTFWLKFDAKGGYSAMYAGSQKFSSVFGGNAKYPANGLLRAATPRDSLSERSRWTFHCNADGTRTITDSEGTYVTAEVAYPDNYNGVLRTREGNKTNPGLWEKFVLESTSDGYWNLRSMGNKKLVSAEFGFGFPYKGALRARANSRDIWEAFTLEDAWF